MIFALPVSCRRRPLTYSLRRDDSEFVVFCFAKPEDAEASADFALAAGHFRPGLLSSIVNFAGPGPRERQEEGTSRAKRTPAAAGLSQL